MKKILKNLADHRALVAAGVFFFCFYAFSLQSERIGFYTTKFGSLGLLKNAGIDIVYIRGSTQFRQFTNKDHTYTFIQKDFGEKTLILGQRLSKNQKSKDYSLFFYKNLSRFFSEKERLIPICTGTSGFSKYKSFSKGLEGLVSAVDNQMIESCFDKGTCDSGMPLEEAANAVRISLKSTVNRIHECLFENKNVEVREKLETNDQFSRIMFTYLVNLEAFTKSLFSNKQVLEFKCTEASTARLDRRLTSRSSINEVTKFSISLPKTLIKGLISLDNSEENEKTFSSQFNRVITHEIDHVFFNIPTVTNANDCEHEYQKFIAKSCPALENQITSKVSSAPNQSIPKCMLGSEPSLPTENGTAATIVPNTAVLAAAEADARKTDGDISATSAAGIGLNKDPGVIAARVDQANEVSVRGAAGFSDLDTTPQVRQQLSGSEESTVRRTADSLFGPAQSGNTQIQDYANQIFTTTNAQRQQQLAEQITAQLDTRLDAFSRSADDLQSTFGKTLLKGAVGTTAVAATLPAAATFNRTMASSNGGGVPAQTASAANWTAQQAFNSYVTGNSGSADSAATVKIAGKLTSSAGGVSAMASANGSTRGSAIQVTSGSNSRGQLVSGKMGASTTNQVVIPTQTDATSGGQTAYQLDGQTSGVRDTPTLRMLSSSATTISGNSYKAITKDYKSEDFVRGLKDRRISIRVIDPKSRKLRTTYGIQIAPDAQTRQPSSIVSGRNAKKQSPPDIVFEDNGTSLRKKDD